jgi:serine/threonine-protein kinase RsbW
MTASLAQRLSCPPLSTAESGGRPALALRLTYPARAESLPPVRRTVARRAEELGADGPVAEAVALAVTEACTNVVVHAYRGDSGAADMTVSVERSDDGLRVCVADDGVGMVPRSDSPGLGLGMPLISELTDGFEVRGRPRGGTELCMRFGLRAA